MSDPNPTGARFAVCIRNDGYPASLEPRKLYQVVSDADAAATGQLRIIDESGAHAQVEAVIGELAGHAVTALDKADVDDDARAVLRQLASAATQRVV